jgi:hypothetical protein
VAKDQSNPTGSFPAQGIETYRLQSALLKFGVTLAGAHQFLTGLPVANANDRAALISLLSQLLQEGGPVSRRPSRGSKKCSCGSGGGGPRPSCSKCRHK